MANKDTASFSGERSEVERLRLVYKVLAATSQATLRGEPVESIINRVISGVKELTGLDAVSVYLYDADINHLHTHDTGLTANLINKMEDLVGLDLRGFVPRCEPGLRFYQTLIEGNYFVETDGAAIKDLFREFTESKRLLAFTNAALKILRIKCMGAVSLQTDGIPIGLIVFSGRHAVEPDVMEHVRLLTGEIALALNAARGRQALKDSEERYRFMLDNQIDAIFLIPFQGDRFANFVEVNQRACELYGYTREEFLKIGPQQIIDFGDATPKAQQEFRTKLAEQKHLTVETVTHKTSGEIFPVEISANLLEYRGLSYIMAFVRDISEREETNRALSESELRFRMLFQRSHDAVYQIEASSGRYLQVNDATERLTGYSREALLKMMIRDTAPENADKRLQMIQNMEDVLDLGKVTFVRPDGSERIAEVTSFNMYDGTVFGIAHDVTDQEQARVYAEALRELASRLTHQLAPKEVGRTVAEEIRKVFAFDAFILDYFDRERLEVRGIYMEDTPVDGDKPLETHVSTTTMSAERMDKILGKSQLINRPEKDLKAELTPAGYSERESKSLIFVPVSWEGKQIATLSLQSYTVNTFKRSDIEKLQIFADQVGGALVRAMHEEALRKNQEELELSLQEKETLLREVHHRVKNNLNVIASLLNLQAHRLVDKEQALDAFQESRNRIQTMALIHERIYASENFSRINMTPYVQEISRFLMGLLNPGGEIHFSIEVEDIAIDVNAAIPCGLIINELVSNALRHAFPDNRTGKLTVRLTRDEKGIHTLSVADDGVGIPEDVEFAKVPTLGLYLVNLLTEQLRGRVEVDRSQGTRVAIHFESLPD